ncbi:MAG: flagellar biosynthetic protein FliR/type secretion protein SpaR/YscT/HrcT [Thermoleophilia bacterium]|nr:flagellar biosynthetic protein FliR/type secretion protein SpaR/YscT/HrcT [Thermoleophilia bacterium]
MSLLLATIPQIDPAVAARTFGNVIGAKDPVMFLLVGAAVLARVLGFMIVAPFFGGMNIPMTARVGMSVILTAVIEPYVEGPVGASLLKELHNGGSFDMLLLCANQVLVGLMLGFCASFIFYAIESAGRVIDTQRGSNITDIIAPQTGERTSPIGQWLMMVALVILLTSGMHMEMLTGFINTFKIFPPTIGLEWLGDPLNAGPGHPELEGTLKAFATMSGDSLLLTLQIAAPAMITLMLTDVLLGIINRGAPQVNVFALSQIVKGPIGIAAVMIALIPMWNYIRDDAIPRFATGKGSITTLAEKMQCSSAEGERIKRGDTRTHDHSCNKVSDSDGGSNSSGSGR